MADKAGIVLGYDTAGAGIVAARTESSGQPLAFWTYNGSAWGERARISKEGNVGIGTTSPGAKLHVANSLSGAEATYRGNIIVESGETDAAANGLEFKSGNSSGGYGFRLATIIDAAGTGHDFRIQGRSNNATWTSRLSVNSTTGNVGIGTTSPISTLYAQGSVTISESGKYVDGNIYQSSDGSSAGTFIGSGYIMTAQVCQAAMLINRNGSDGNAINFYRSG